MSKQYDLTKPRYTVVTHRYPNGDFETPSVEEAAFWIRIGYVVLEHTWNGSVFVTTNSHIGIFRRLYHGQ